ncbi:MAG: glycosyltransferase WbuB [Bacteroidetes bacterium]|nr:MAG: glycosyltransferase WbuB [Bacteroidota bacterium]
MKILVLTQYFPPEVGAPQSRLYELMSRLKKKGADITVITAMPNYPQMAIHDGYKGRLVMRDNFKELTVIRSWLFVSRNSTLFARMLNYFSFVLTSMFTGLFMSGKQDYVFCESPPLFLGISAYVISKFKRARLIFNVSDLWPESAEKLGLVTNKAALTMATWLEEFLYRRSWLITTQTGGIRDNISNRISGEKVYWLKNGANNTLFDPSISGDAWRLKQGYNENDMVIMYAGILGHAQGLEVILRAAKELRANDAIKFVMIGSGPERKMLVALKEEMNLDNLTFIPAQPKEAMPEILAAANAVVIPLKNIDLFKGAIPSKLFESAQMCKAILLGVLGEAKEMFIDDGKAGLAFEPENHLSLVTTINLLFENRRLEREYGDNGFNYVNAQFNLDMIASHFWERLKDS